MKSPAKHRQLWFLLHPASVWLFVLLAALWLAAWILRPDGLWDSLGGLCRFCGYLATLAMLVPYVHILRRRFRHRFWGSLTVWLWWHLATGYLAFLLVLVHSRGQANSPLTQAIVGVLWLVMLSGAVGFYGQKLLYWLLPRLVKREYGRERIAVQRALFLHAGQARCADLLVKKWDTFVKNSALHALLKGALSGKEATEELEAAIKKVRTEEPKAAELRDEEELDRGKAVVHEAIGHFLATRDVDLAARNVDTAALAVSDPELFGLLKADARALTARQLWQRNHALLPLFFPGEFHKNPPGLLDFCDRALLDCLERPLRMWEEVRAGGGYLSENTLAQVLGAAGAGQGAALEKLWNLVKDRRQLNLEYRLHQIGRLWLLVHGPAAWVLAVLVVIHIAVSVYYGGF
jgi:hypothetical protein